MGACAPNFYYEMTKNLFLGYIEVHAGRKTIISSEHCQTASCYILTFLYGDKRGPTPNDMNGWTLPVPRMFVVVGQSKFIIKQSGTEFVFYSCPAVYWELYENCVLFT